MRKRQGTSDVAGVSFLDCICCGFGAIVLLLVIVKVHDPILTEERRAGSISTIESLKRDLLALVVERTALESERNELRAQVESEEARVESLGRTLEKAASEYRSTAESLRRLTAEERVASRHPEIPSDEKIGGIPADSNYIIFIIDTSGSMHALNWDRVIEKVGETLELYPDVKGIQVLNDMGKYMLSSYAGRWIPDTETSRRIIRERLRGWKVFSNSSPVEGIEKAIQTFHGWDKKISIYVFGDEFTGDSVQDVIDAVDRLNRPDAQGRRRVRIHGIGFSSEIDNANFQLTNRRFAALMRALCARNGGTFVGL